MERQPSLFARFVDVALFVVGAVMVAVIVNAGIGMVLWSRRRQLRIHLQSTDEEKLEMHSGSPSEPPEIFARRVVEEFIA